MEREVLFTTKLFDLVWERNGIYENVFPVAHNYLNRTELLKLLNMPEPFPTEKIVNWKDISELYIKESHETYLTAAFNMSTEAKRFLELYVKSYPLSNGHAREVTISQCGKYVFKFSTYENLKQTARSLYISSISCNPLLAPIFAILKTKSGIVAVEPYLGENMESIEFSGKERWKYIHESVNMDGYIFLWRGNYCPMFFDGVEMLYGSNQFIVFQNKPFWFDLGESSDSKSGTCKDDLLRMIRDFNDADFSVLNKLPKDSFFLMQLGGNYIEEYIMSESFTFNKKMASL